MKQFLQIMSLVFGVLMFGLFVYLVEHPLELRMSKAEYKPPVRVGVTVLVTPTVVNLDEMIITGTDIGVAREFDEGVQRMTHVQSSVPLQWLSETNHQNTVTFGKLKDRKLKPDVKLKKNTR